MSTGRLFHFSESGFGRPFEATVARACRELGLPLTLVLADPVKGMGALRRRVTRISRPIRRLLKVARRRQSVWLVEDVNDPSFYSRLPPGSHGLITAFMQIFKRPAIARFESFVNVHPSLLPYYRGPDPFYWLEVHGEERSGYTLHHVTEQIDAGPIVSQEVVTIADRDASQAVIAAAQPAVVAWVRHLALGEPVAHVEVDAGSVYKVLYGYGPLLEHRRPAPPRRGLGRIRSRWAR